MYFVRVSQSSVSYIFGRVICIIMPPYVFDQTMYIMASWANLFVQTIYILHHVRGNLLSESHVLQSTFGIMVEVNAREELSGTAMTLCVGYRYLLPSSPFLQGKLKVDKTLDEIPLDLCLSASTDIIHVSKQAKIMSLFCDLRRKFHIRR
jgi:hypothetical protein